MMRRSLNLFVLAVAVAVAVPATAETTIQTVFDHYQVVRLAMVEDRVDATSAAALEAAVASLRRDLSAAEAGIDAASLDAARELLDEVHAGTTALAAAGSALDPARDALYAITKPLVRYRELMVGEKPAVAYCPMAKKSWLQLETDTIGNPYHGSEMPRCGSIVSE